MGKYGKKGTETVWVVIFVLALLVAAVIGQYVFLVIHSKLPLSMFDFVSVAVFNAVCIALLIFSQAERIILKLEELEGQRNDLMIVNGFSLSAIMQIENRVWSYALSKSMMIPNQESATLGAAAITLLPNIQKDLDLLFKWMNTPTREKFPKSYDELLEFLILVKQQVKSYQ